MRMRTSSPLLLVIDDEAPIRQLVADLLCAEGYRVQQASNGLKALDLLRHLRPRAIVLDLSMPEVNGFEFLACYEHLTGGSVPAVVISAELNPTAVARLKTLGIDLCLSKPFDVDDLVSKVRLAVNSEVPATFGCIDRPEPAYLRDLIDAATRRLHANHALLIRAEDTLGWSQARIADYYMQCGVAVRKE
jgi:CheY-like chemotaxis protein